MRAGSIPLFRAYNPIVDLESDYRGAIPEMASHRADDPLGVTPEIRIQNVVVLPGAVMPQLHG